MAENTHYFIAVPVDKSVKKAIFNWRVEENPPFKCFVHQEDYHITLAFLGTISQSLLEQLKQDLQTIAEKQRHFVLTVDGVDYYGQKQSPRVFWASVKRQQMLFSLHQDVYNICTNRGLEIDKRPYSPHITIARKYSGETPFKSEEHNHSFHSSVKNQNWTVSSFVIFKTNLQRIPKYEVIASFPLR